MENISSDNLNGGVPRYGPRFSLPSSLHPPAACTPSHPSHHPNPSCFRCSQSLPGTNCVHLIPHSYPCHLHLWSASKGLFASRSSQIAVQRSSFSLRFLGTSASSLSYSSVPPPKETVHVCAPSCISLQRRREEFRVSLQSIIH